MATILAAYSTEAVPPPMAHCPDVGGPHRVIEPEWTDVVTLPPPPPAVNRERELGAALDVWLQGNGFDPAALDDDDIRVDLVYLGRGRGCEARLRVRTAALRPAGPALLSPVPFAAATTGPEEWLERLLAAEVDGSLPEFLFFWGHTAKADRPGPWVLSQWWPASFTVDGVEYRHAEAFMMAEKARLFGDDETRRRILAADHPAQAKDLGRRVRSFDEQAWEQARFAIVVRANLAKFGQHRLLRRYLLSTAPRVLVEASPHDRVWGIGLGANDDRARRPSEWRGANLLGFALTSVRDRLASSSART